MSCLRTAAKRESWKLFVVVITDTLHLFSQKVTACESSGCGCVAMSNTEMTGDALGVVFHRLLHFMYFLNVFVSSLCVQMCSEGLFGCIYEHVLFFIGSQWVEQCF